MGCFFGFFFEGKEPICLIGTCKSNSLLLVIYRF